MGEWSASSGSQATHIKTLIGKVTNYFSHQGIVEVTLDKGDLQVGDALLITGPTTGIIQMQVESLKKDKTAADAEKNSVVTFPISYKARKNDRVFILEKRALKVVP